MSSPTLSIIIPVINEAASIENCLRTLAPLRERGAELIVVDGGSDDDTVQRAWPLASRVLVAPGVRALQMNAGAAVARAHSLLFLHPDSQLPDQADGLIHQALAQGAAWGRFDLRISGHSPMLPVVAALMNLRSRLTGIATGEQAIFVGRDWFEAVGGFPPQAVMEDIEISKRLRALSTPACLRERVSAPGWRWEARGVWPTVFLMWRLRWRYWRGESPEGLAREYR